MMHSFVGQRKSWWEKGWVIVYTPEILLNEMVDLLSSEFGPVTQVEGSFVAGDAWAIRAMNSKSTPNGEFVQQVTQVAFAPGPAATWAALRWS